jgi:hypothetical protein
MHALLTAPFLRILLPFLIGLIFKRLFPEFNSPSFYSIVILMLGTIVLKTIPVRFKGRVTHTAFGVACFIIMFSVGFFYQIKQPQFHVPHAFQSSNRGYFMRIESIIQKPNGTAKGEAILLCFVGLCLCSG